MDKLKPCPFCGGEPAVCVNTTRFDGRKLMTLACCIQMMAPEDEIAERWNRRAQSPWIRCSERLPTEADADCDGVVWVYSDHRKVRLELVANIRTEFDTHWKPTNLERPQPPEV